LHSLANIKALKQDANLVIAVLQEQEKVQLDYSLQSISWLDGYIEQHREDLDAQDKSVLEEKFGAYLGESIRHNYGGRWLRVDGEWRIAFDAEHDAQPFALIAAHLDHHTALTELVQRLPDGLRARQN